jgi:hypothetical protein
MALPAVYAWARAADSGPLANGWYLNPGFFIARAAAYFVIWMVFAAFKSLRAAPLPPFLAGLGVILLGVSVAFASIDWLMSVEPHWFSTIYPMIAGASQFIAAMAVVLLVVAAAGPLGIAPEAYRDDLANLATLLLAVVIFWMYTSFCQYLIVWEENLTDEIGWYIERSAGPWGAVAFAVIGAQFVIPFIGLVTTPAKRSRMVVGGIAALLIVADLVQIWWLALPPFHDRGFTWLAPVAAAFIGSGLVLAFFLAQWTRQFPAFAPATEAGHG